MTIEEALAIVETVLETASLNDLQEVIFRQSWERKTYPQIAEEFGYDAEYIKIVGFRLWKMLSQAMGEKVTKDNLRSTLRRWCSRSIQERGIREAGEASEAGELEISPPSPRQSPQVGKPAHGAGSSSSPTSSTSATFFRDLTGQPWL